jgi:hypothetical protein
MLNFFNLYEVKCSMGLVFLQYYIRYAESSLQSNKAFRINMQYAV